LQKKIFFIANYNVLGLFIPKKRYKSEKNYFRLSRGVAGIAVVAGVASGFWTKFEAQLDQPC
jgi:hypothetical protein